MELKFDWRWVVGSKLKIFAIALSLVAQLSFSAPAHAEPTWTGDRPLAQEVVQPEFEPERRYLILMSLAAVVVDGNTVGALAVYDDPITKRPVDYIELYNSPGDLVAVSWFDEFGIQRVAVDRALLKDAVQPEGVFVLLLEGDAI